MHRYNTSPKNQHVASIYHHFSDISTYYLRYANKCFVCYNTTQTLFFSQSIAHFIMPGSYFQVRPHIYPTSCYLLNGTFCKITDFNAFYSLTYWYLLPDIVDRNKRDRLDNAPYHCSKITCDVVISINKLDKIPADLSFSQMLLDVKSSSFSIRLIGSTGYCKPYLCKTITVQAFKSESCIPTPPKRSGGNLKCLNIS